ncbi:MAG: DUF4231 domain-containing protein [Actinocatenispora sp.]
MRRVIVTVSALPDSALPGLFQAADATSREGQRAFKRASAVRLVCAIAAAVSAAFAWSVGARQLDLAAALTGLFFVGAVLVELWLLAAKPAEAWYDGRALAESAKTLAWRYAVGGAPFPVDAPHADRQLAADLEELVLDAPDTEIEPSTDPPVSAAMRALREAGFAIRKSVYLDARIGGQIAWYSGKARYNRSRSRKWRSALIAAELLGLASAGARFAGVVTFDLPGIVAAAIGAGAAWLAIQQHESLVSSYSLTAEELSTVRANLQDIGTETEWAAQVADAEEAISREHIMWRASRCSPRFVRRLNRHTEKP